MSQKQQEKMDDAAQDTAPIADVAVKPPLSPKKSPLMAIIAIIVVVSLVLTFLLVMLPPPVQPASPELSVRVTPTSVSIANGSQIALISYATFKNSSSDAVGTNVSTSVSLRVDCKWFAGETSLGTLQRGMMTNGQIYYLLQSEKVGTSSLNWTFHYIDEDVVSHYVYKRVNVTVGIAVLSYIEIDPAEMPIFKGTSQLFMAKAKLTNGTEVPANFTWWLRDSYIGTITPLNGSNTTFTAGLVNASGDLVCNGTYLGMTASQTAKVTVFTVLPPASTTTRIYNLLNQTFGDYWDDRLPTDGNVLRKTFPVSYECQYTEDGVTGTTIYSSSSMDVVAVNISTVNTLTNPLYVPVFHPSVRGGNIDIDYYGKYINATEANEIGGKTADSYDGWITEINGTVTMDKTAAKMVLDMTDSEFNEFNTWKQYKYADFETKFSTWYKNLEASVYSIWFCYEWPLDPLSEKYDIEKVGDKIVFKILSYVSWGAEYFLAKLWINSFLDYEISPDSFHFVAKIGPLVSNFTLDAVSPYSLSAMTSLRDGRTSWGFENWHLDYLPGSKGSYDSEFNPYVGKEYFDRYVGDSTHGSWIEYDYTPTAWSLGANDTIIIQWPSEFSPVMGYNHVGPANISAVVPGKLSPLWIEPIPGEVPSNVFIDDDAKTITIKGPFDAEKWSKTTLAGRELRENWSRLDVLPQGVPRIEFVVTNDANQKPVAIISAPQLYGVNSPLTLRSASYDIENDTLTYDWYLEGHGHVNTKDVTRQWSAIGNYTIILNVSDGTSTTSDTIILQISLNPLPIAKLSDSNPYGDIQTPTVFNGDESYDQGDGTIEYYLWDFGDGITANSTTSSTSHQYTSMGMYNVTLTVVDDMGGNDSDTVTFVITTDLCAKIAMQRAATIGESVVIKGDRSFTFSAYQGRSLVNWTWDFGDGSRAYTQNVSHAWSSAGTFTVNLFVKDSIGLQSLNATAKITIVNPAVSGLGLSLARHSLLPGETTTLTIKAVNGAGKVVTTFTGDVDIAANGSGWTLLPNPVTLVAGVGTATVSCTDDGSYNITAAVQGSPSQNGSIFATVNNRTVEIKICGIFEQSLPDFWKKRAEKYFLFDKGFRNYTPSILISKYSGTPQSASLTTSYMLNVEARNVPEINMSSPTFTGLKNPITGRGNATVALDFHTLTEAEWYAMSPAYIDSKYLIYWIGSEGFLTCNITMDREAAEQIIGLPLPTTLFTHSNSTTRYLDTAANLSCWWDTDDGTGMPGNDSTMSYWFDSGGYLASESGKGSYGRLDTSACMYDEDTTVWYHDLWDHNPFRNDIMLNKSMRLVYLDANNVSLSYWYVGIGYEKLLSRFLYWGGIGSGTNYPYESPIYGYTGIPNGIVPFEASYSNISLMADIHQNCANLTMYATVDYGFTAWTSDVAPAGTPIFRWEPVRLDYWVSDPNVGMGLSELDIYRPNLVLNLSDPYGGYDPSLDPQYLLRDPGSSTWGSTGYYKAAPDVVTLVEGESIFMQAPRALAVGYLPQKLIGNPTDISNFAGGYYEFLKIIEVFGNATIHPVGCYPDTYTIDKEMGDLTIVGPFVPIITYRTDIPSLVEESAPRIELWIQ